MLLIVGLGNPGVRYAKNRHNIGFMAVDEMHLCHQFSPWQKKFQSEIANGVIEETKVFLLKPRTFMNLSGQAVREVISFYTISLSDLVIIHDDLDLLPGKVRVKIGGGSGGHNGVKSIDAHCGKDYYRVRLGIGHPDAKELVHGYVLDDFSKTDNEWLKPFLRAIADNTNLLVRKERSSFMNRISLTMNALEKSENDQNNIRIKHLD